MAKEIAGPQWIDGLDDEDLAFIKRFILASGSLKDTEEILPARSGGIALLKNPW